MESSGGTLKDGELVQSGNAKLIFTSAGGTLDGVTVNGDLDLAQQNGDSLTVHINLVLNATRYVGSADGSTHGSVQFG
ncbi:MAG: hypothetical protein RIC12_02180 [Pirellulales bacterium]